MFMSGCKFGSKFTSLAPILTGPWGELADVFGKKKVIFLNTLSIIIN